MCELEQNTRNIIEFITQGIFEITGEDQLAKLKDSFSTPPETDESREKLIERWNQFLRDKKVQIGTLLKTDHLSFLLGAGVSKDAGGVLLGKIPLEVENTILQRGASSSRLRAWLKIFYLAAKRLSSDDDMIPVERDEIFTRKERIEQVLQENDEQARSQLQIAIGFENLLSLLYNWRCVLSDFDNRLRIDGTIITSVNKDSLDKCLIEIITAFVECCRLPRNVNQEEAILPFSNFLKKILTRPLNLKRTNIFTLNYDLMIEKAADANGFILLDGFLGTQKRIFRPDSYDHDLYFPGDTTEGRVHRLDRVIHLYKLHGSINWISTVPTWNNPYGVSVEDEPEQGSRILIYPTPAKYGETLGMPYAELFRRFASAVVRPQSTLIVIGYGFGDPHVNTIIRQALTIPSFTLVIVDPSPPEPSTDSTMFVSRLRAVKDGRTWILGGKTFGTFANFVEHVLPDLHDQQVMRKVVETHRSLGDLPDTRPNSGVPHAE